MTPTRTLQPLTVRNVAGEPVSLRQELRDLARYRNLLGELVRHDLTVRYRGSALGLLWTMIHPLAMMGIFLLVFSNLFRFEIRNYETYFLSGYLAWMFISQTVTHSIARMAWNGSLMGLLPIPRSIFALASTISGAINLCIALGLLFLIMLFFGSPIRATVLFLPIPLLVIGTFVLGLCLALSSLAVLYADVKEMVQAALPALMYLTPVVYPISIVPARFRRLIEVNPLTAMVEMLRVPIYEGALPSATVVMTSTASAAVALVAGWLVFRRLAPEFHAHV